MPTATSRSRPLPRRSRSAVDYQALADLRSQIRQFLRARELAARAAGVEPQQYLVLLQIKGLEGRAEATIGALAARLQIRHHAVVQLVDRLEERGLVERRRGGRDRRAVIVTVRPSGETVLRRLAAHSLAELKTEAPALVRSLMRLVGPVVGGPPPVRRSTKVR